MADIKLLVTDFDGTLVGKTNEFPVFKQFREIIETLRRAHGTIWLPCTGRSLSSFRQVFGPMALMDIVPDYLIVHHGFVYQCANGRYYPNLGWNLHMLRLLWRERLHMRGCIDRWHRMMFKCTTRVQTVVHEDDRLWVRFDKKEAAEMAADLLQPHVALQKHFQLFRYLVELDIRSVPFTKGIAVQELAQHLEIPAANILAIGDGYNDISMLDPAVAGMLGCPGNAEPEVKEAVHQAGGHIATQDSLAGVVEVIRAHMDGAVRSALPADWQPPALGHNPSSVRRAKRVSSRHRRRMMLVRHIIMILVTLYVVLAVFASFGIIPVVSGHIMRPINRLMDLVFGLF